MCVLTQCVMHLQRSFQSYLQCRRHVLESVATTIDPEWVLSNHKWHRWRDALIQIVEFHGELTWMWNIVGSLYSDWLGLQNWRKNYLHFHLLRHHLLVRDWNRPKRWTSSWKRARLLLEIDPYSIQFHFAFFTSEALSYHLFLFCKTREKKRWKFVFGPSKFLG